MAMLLHVRTKPRRAAFQLHLANEAAFHERVEAVVNRRMGNFRHRLLRAHENFLRRRMVALLHDHVIDVLALWRETKAARAQLFSQVLLGFTVGDDAHYRLEV